MKLSEFIKEKNKNLEYKLTYTKVAEILNVSRQYLSTIRDKELSVKNLNILTEYFNKNVNKNFDFIKIPVYGNVTASMGYGITVYDENQTGVYEISQKLAKDIGIIPGKTEMIFASGDSMYPTIEGGDSLLIDTSKKRNL